MTTRPRTIDDVSPEEQEIQCPKCRTLMRRQRVGEVDIDRCQSCGGLWLDALEKEKLLRSKAVARAADAAASTPRHLPKPKVLCCPRDTSLMIRMVDAGQPHVAFEACTVCGGVFLDAGELKDLSEKTLRERLRSLVPGA